MAYTKFLFLISILFFSCTNRVVSPDDLNSSLKSSQKFLQAQKHSTNAELAECILTISPDLSSSLSQHIKALPVQKQIKAVPNQAESPLLSTSCTAKALQALMPSTELNELRSLALFLVFMKNKKGGFYPLYIPAKDIKFDSPALEDNGEVALTLLKMYHRDPLNIWYKNAYHAILTEVNQSAGQGKKAIDRLLKKKSKSSATKTSLPAATLAKADNFFHAVKLLLETNQPKSATKVKLQDYCAQLCRGILKTQVIKSHDSDYLGAFSKLGRTSISAKSIYSLILARSILPPDHELQPALRKSIDRGIYFLVQCQHEDGSFPYAIKKVKLKSKEAQAFNNKLKQKRLSDSLDSYKCLQLYKSTLPKNSAAH